jgi:hypothetical protein
VAAIVSVANGLSPKGPFKQIPPNCSKKFLQREKITTSSTVRFNSPGGNLLAGIKLGEAIRSAGLFTAVGKTVGEQTSFDPGTIEEKRSDVRDGICASACVYAFVGGKTRFAHKSKIGIHQFYDPHAADDPLAKTASSVDRSRDQLLAGILLEYIIRMGIDPKLVSLASTIPPWQDMMWLNSQELIDLRIDNSEMSFTPLSVEPFGSTGSYAETVSRSAYYSFRHRIYCKGNANSPYIAFLSDPNLSDAESLRGALVSMMEKKGSVALIGENGERVFPVRVVALDISRDGSQTVQGSAIIIGATMSDLQATNRVEYRGELYGHYENDLAFWLSFNLTGDRRKIGIASRSCLK